MKEEEEEEALQNYLSKKEALDYHLVSIAFYLLMNRSLKYLLIQINNIEIFSRLKVVIVSLARVGKDYHPLSTSIISCFESICL